MRTNRTRRKPRLTDSQLAEVNSALKKAPSESEYNVWDGPSLSDFIQKKFGVFLCVRRCQYMMHEIGFSLIGNIEAGRVKPSFDTIERFAEALGVHPADLFLRDSSRSNADIRSELKSSINSIIDKIIVN